MSVTNNMTAGELIVQNGASITGDLQVNGTLILELSDVSSGTLTVAGPLGVQQYANVGEIWA
jgi:hypothetical protein